MIVAFENEEGGVSVVYPADKTAIDDVVASLDGKRLLVLDISHVPSDREFRGAWRLGESSIEFDMVSARDIKRDALRAERKPMLEELDIAAIRSLSSPEELVAIEAKKQKLRDAPASIRIESAASVEELKEITLQSLIG